MDNDYISKRQNTVNAPTAELNAKLIAVVEAFDELWLTGQGVHPLQVLWKRQDALATNELLNFGDALQRYQQKFQSWLNGQIYKIKNGDAGESSGAIFEILALNLFSPAACELKPAPNNQPGYDATLKLEDGSSIFVSVKNHGISSAEREFAKEAKSIDEAFKSSLTSNNLRDLETDIIATRHLSTSDYTLMRNDIANCVSDITHHKFGGHIERPYTIFIKGMAAQYGELSRFASSSGCRILVPLASNEQQNFISKIEVGCSNLFKHTQHATEDDCRMILLRLSKTASIAKCRDWASSYFASRPETSVDVIVLYQCVITNNQTDDTTSLTHFVCPIFGPRFVSWRQGKKSRIRNLPNLEIFVGVVSWDPPQLMLVNERGDRLNVADFYMYQRVDAYQKVVLEAEASITLNNPASGIHVQAYFEQNGSPLGPMSLKFAPQQELLLLP